MRRGGNETNDSYFNIKKSLGDLKMIGNIYIILKKKKKNAYMKLLTF